MNGDFPPMREDRGPGCWGCVMWIVILLVLLTLGGWVFQQLGINQPVR
jgi:hypothetical protein